ncbi:hypothetical protein [Marilutibacter spongiae]|uniref:Uncharacterized protein n=1 Tax=Marilutibacter spongiae TaxID=2025720 RepID=A0A7W3Y5T4_9GAMM|nr:hypothetical protein [Lysobacter spongiae]MBB1060374.1 hypothetical protein [Lysobacter spongiae]
MDKPNEHPPVVTVEKLKAFQETCRLMEEVNERRSKRQQERITELEAEVARLREDAERYRWLKDKADLVTKFLLLERREADEWDEEIDAARAKEGE